MFSSFRDIGSITGQSKGGDRHMADVSGIEARLEAVIQSIASVRRAVGDVIIGQDAVISQSFAAILAGGHTLITGVPGLGKTRLVETFATVLGLRTRRIQFTPDLMPADILGSEVLEDSPNGRRFRFIPGPIFTELLMADEINRASPRTQSALLQAMAEGAVAVSGENRPVPKPFHVLATQNPLEQEGTYPLPEAQLDRFLLDIRIDYPSAADERRMLLATTGAAATQPSQVITAAQLIDAQALVRAMPVGASVVDGILQLVRGAGNRRLGRPENGSRLGPWPARRASAYARLPRSGPAGRPALA